MNKPNWRPDLSDEAVRRTLKPRQAPYFELIQYGRHLGLQVHTAEFSSWIGRVRNKRGGYSRHRLGYASFCGREELSHEEALRRAHDWFSSPAVQAMSSQSYPVGGVQELSICPIGDAYSVGHALAAYVEWKRLAATPSNFSSLLSVINHHLVPRVSAIALNEFNGSDFHALAVDVLESAPKYGRQPQGQRTSIKELSEEDLRKRKKTLNRLVSILRGSFEIAWEHGFLDHDRPMRCLRRLPNWDRPRIVFLDRAECRRLLASCHADLRPLVLAALYTGCRANELTGLRVGDFDRKAHSIFIAKPKGRRTRHVFLPDEGYEFFLSLVQGKAASERVFRKSNGRSWGSEYKTYFQAARNKAGLPSELSFHGLRHTYASQLVQSGASLIVVADQLGHASTQTVSATYGHLIGGHQHREVNKHFDPITKQASSRTKARPETLPDSDVARAVQVPAPISWPRANHAKYSGRLLEQIRRL